MQRSIRPFLLAAAVTVVSASTAQAQSTFCGNTAAGTATCSPAGVEVTTTVLKIVHITVAPASAALTAPTDTDFELGGTVTLTDAGLHTLTIRANVAWEVTLVGAAWTAPYVKAVDDLEFTFDAGANWDPMDAVTPTSIGTGAATNGATITLGYRTLWSLDVDEPGAYTMPLTVTVSST